MYVFIYVCCLFRYKKMYQWVDGTIAYLANLLTDYNHGLPGCGIITTYKLQIEIISCKKRQVVEAVLCELPKQTTIHTKSASELGNVSRIRLRSPDPWLSNDSHVQCPSRHVTHIFLACDVNSACWGRGYGSAFSCTAPLAPTPPSFTCNNDIEHVPYTLVCDHRPDCGDDSDEDFCHFPPCDIIHQFECGHQQVQSLALQVFTAVLLTLF